MRNVYLAVVFALAFFNVQAQTVLSGNYKIIDMGDNGYGDFTRSLILLHEIYNGVNIDHNFSSGTITAMRGHAAAGNRQNIVLVNTSSSYSGTVGTITSYDDIGTSWKLKTCIYAGKKYLAVEVPYVAAYHDRGFKFSGATFSTAEGMKCISYEVAGQPVNQNLISAIQDFSSNMTETHEVYNLNITGNVGIGTTTPNEKLAVNGKIRAKEIKVETANWPDYVFREDYKLPSLAEIQKHINEKGHLPGIPSATDVEKNGIDLGEMNRKLLEKVEELTLHLINLQKENLELKIADVSLKKMLDEQKTDLNKLKAINKIN